MENLQIFRASLNARPSSRFPLTSVVANLSSYVLVLMRAFTWYGTDSGAGIRFGSPDMVVFQLNDRFSSCEKSKTNVARWIWQRHIHESEVRYVHWQRWQSIVQIERHAQPMPSARLSNQFLLVEYGTRSCWRVHANRYWFGQFTALMILCSIRKGFFWFAGAMQSPQQWLGAQKWIESAMIFLGLLLILFSCFFYNFSVAFSIQYCLYAGSAGLSDALRQIKMQIIIATQMFHFHYSFSLMYLSWSCSCSPLSPSSWSPHQSQYSFQLFNFLRSTVFNVFNFNNRNENALTMKS